VQRREDTAGFADGRALTVRLAQLQALADASPRVAQLREIAEVANAATVQRMSDEEEDEEFDGGAVQLAADPHRRNETGMPDSLKSGIESLSGLDMSSVRVHRNSDKPAQLNARAYAQGTDIHLAPGQERHLPHEAWHVVQQMQGRVQPTMQMNDERVAINDDAGLEKEADLQGDHALAAGMSVVKSGGADRPKLDSMSSVTSSRMILSRNTLVQLCKNPRTIAADKTFQERLVELQDYATQMVEKCMAHADGGSLELDWYEVADDFVAIEQRIVDFAASNPDPTAGESMLDTFCDFIDECNSKYETVKSGKSLHNRSGLSTFDIGDEKIDENNEPEDALDGLLEYERKILSLPGVSDVKTRKAEAIDKSTKEAITRLCQEMRGLKEAMLHGKNDAGDTWENLCCQLCNLLTEIYQKNPEQYLTLLRKQIPQEIKSTYEFEKESAKKMGGLMCNEAIPDAVLKKLKNN
jgi:hypothetical protein